MTPRVFWNAFDGWFEVEESKQRADWIRSRWMTCYLLNVHLPRNRRVEQQKLIKFDWEKNMSEIKTYEESLELIEKNRKKKKAK